MKYFKILLKCLAFISLQFNFHEMGNGVTFSMYTAITKYTYFASDILYIIIYSLSIFFNLINLII